MVERSNFSGAVILAAVLHLIILTLQFAMPQESDAAVKEIAVTLRPTKDKIENADFLAQADQQGSGTFREAHRMSRAICQHPCWSKVPVRNS